MNIFNDIHTYLVISFLAMVLLLYKFAYNQIVSFIQNKINAISNSIKQAENDKENAEAKVHLLEKTVVETQEKALDSITKAHESADKIMAQSNETVNKIITEKEQEYQNIIEKVKNSVLAEMKKKFIECVHKEILRMMDMKRNKRSMHNAAIEKSIAMFESALKEEENEDSSL